MIITDWIHTIAGSFILIGLALGLQLSPLYQSQYWLLLTAFVGANLLQYGITKFCPLAYLLKAFGIPEAR